MCLLESGKLAFPSSSVFFLLKLSVSVTAYLLNVRVPQSGLNFFWNESLNKSSVFLNKLILSSEYVRYKIMCWNAIILIKLLSQAVRVICPYTIWGAMHCSLPVSAWFCLLLSFSSLIAWLRSISGDLLVEIDV